MSNLVPPGSPAAAIVAEEERLLGQVAARAAMGEDEDEGPRASDDDIDRDLISLRDQIGEARAEDLPPLIEQMTQIGRAHV